MNLLQFSFAFLLIVRLSAGSIPLSKRCLILKENALVHLCSGKYPEDITLKYRDQIIHPGEPYSIYQFVEDKQSYFFAFRKSDVHRCKNLQLIKEQQLNCLDEENKKEIIFERGFVRCVEFHLQMADDLVQDCLGTPVKDKSAFVALHYASADTTDRTINSASLPNLADAVCVIMVITVLTLLFV